MPPARQRDRRTPALRLRQFLTGPFLPAAARVAAVALVAAFSLPRATAAEGFLSFIDAIPETDADGIPLAGANTVFADGTGPFIPSGNVARSDNWAWRPPFGNNGILNSLGPTTSTPPANTRELATTVTGLEPGSEYSVRALFWAPGGDNGLWGLRAGLEYGFEGRTNPWLNKNSPEVAPANMLPWEVLPSLFQEGGRTLYAAFIGTATASLDGELTLYVHDYPSANSNLRTWYEGVAVAPMMDAAPHVIDAGAEGQAFNPGVRGVALADLAMTRGDYHFSLTKTLEVSHGGSIRGVATGLAADIYDWRTRNNGPRPPTLEFLRFSRDHKAELWLGANMRGLIEPDPDGGIRYYDTDPATLAEMAGEWVRYVNHIVPTYRQGDPIDDFRDAAILDSLTWSSDVPGDSFDKLLAPEERKVPRIAYWEIGNEPTIGVTAYSVTNSFTLNPTEFHQRYRAIALAIKEEDPTVKVGPTLVNGGREGAHLSALVSDPSVPIDFITYHPYEKMGLLDDPGEITRHLGSVHTRQAHFLNQIKQVVTEGGRDADAIEYGATEVNVSNWNTNETVKEAEMAHALGTVETIFSHARLGLAVSHYWIWPAHAWDGTEYPVFKAYQKLRDYMGDTLVSTYAFGDVRVYTTRDSISGELAVWALNFSDTGDTTVDLALENMFDETRITLFRLEDASGTTRLHSSNPASDMPGGPASHVNWTSSDLTGTDLSEFALPVPAATLSLLLVEPSMRPRANLLEFGGERWLALTFSRLSSAPGPKYRILGSDDLVTWETVEEIEPGMPQIVTIWDDRPVTGAVRRFLRLEIEPEN